MSKRNLTKIGNLSVDDIVKRTQGQGYGSKNGRRKKLKPLSQSYIRQRRKANLASATSASRSNLTLTGRMLASLRAVVKGKSIIIQPKGANNQKKAAYVSKDRPFITLTKKEEQALVKRVQKDIDKSINKIFK